MMLPKRLAVIKYQAHKKRYDYVIEGNNADVEAKNASGYQVAVLAPVVLIEPKKYSQEIWRAHEGQIVFLHIYCFAHLIVLHFLFLFLFFTIYMLLCCVTFISFFILLHCPLSGPDLMYISLLIIPCIIYYVTNKETLDQLHF